MEITEEQRAELEKPFSPTGSSPSIVVSDEPVADATEQSTTTPVTTETPSEEESKVPYSRFKKFHDAAQEAEREAAYWRGVAEASQNQPATTTKQPTEMPDYWTELYGDSDASLKAWKVQEQANRQMMDQARSEALEAVRNERGQEAQTLQANEAIIDENFEDLADFIGRELTDKEVTAVLDIVDDYTPKGADGNYLGPVIPFEKAWEIYELKNSVSKAPNVQARNQVASLSGAGSQGETNITEKDAQFNPLDWNAWKKRI